MPNTFASLVSLKTLEFCALMPNEISRGIGRISRVTPIRKSSGVRLCEEVRERERKADIRKKHSEAKVDVKNIMRQATTLGRASWDSLFSDVAHSFLYRYEEFFRNPCYHELHVANRYIIICPARNFLAIILQLCK